MSKIDLNKLSSMQYDVLKELGNIGAGNATTALAQMINKKSRHRSTSCATGRF